MKASQNERAVPTLSGKVLIAEDQPEVRQLIRILLETAGMQVVAVDNGEDLVKVGVDPSFDVILTDIQMPKMTGIEATKALHQKGISTPVIALTANIIQPQDKQYQEVGFADSISKPFTRLVFLTTIADVLEQSPALQQNVEDEMSQELSSLTHTFITSLEQQKPLIEQYVSQKKWRDLAGLAHAIVGAASTLGLKELAKSAQLLELALMRTQHPQFGDDCSEQVEKASDFLYHIEQVMLTEDQSEDQHALKD